MTNAVNAGTSYTELAAYKSISTLDSTASFMGYYNNVLWIGTFRQATSTMKGYQVNNKATLPSLSPAFDEKLPYEKGEKRLYFTTSHL